MINGTDIENLHFEEGEAKQNRKIALDIWRDFIRNELNRVDHFNVRLPNPDDEAEGVN